MGDMKKGENWFLEGGGGGGGTFWFKVVFKTPF